MIEIFKELADYLNSSVGNSTFSYYDKDNYSKCGQKAFNKLAKLLKLSSYNVSWNPGGIAVSGDIMLRGMFCTKKGIYISANRNNITWGSPRVLYRSIKHMEDYTGGSNCFFHPSLFKNTKELLATLTNNGTAGNCNGCKEKLACLAQTDSHR